MRTTPLIHLKGKTAGYFLCLTAFSVGLVIGSHLKGFSTNASMTEMILDVFTGEKGTFYQSYAQLFTVYFTGELFLMLSKILIVPVVGIIVFFLTYGIGTGVVTQTVLYGLSGNTRIFYIGLFPTLVITVCCYIILAESLVFSGKKGLNGSRCTLKRDKFAVKLFCITVVLALNSLYFCLIKQLMT
jgi:hypothetical protein